MSHRLFSSISLAISSSISLIAHDNNSLAANLRSRWSWIDNILIQSIVNGDFDIHSLSKLHSEEFLRKKFIISIIEEFFILMNNIKTLELRDDILKLYASFNDINIFLFA